MHLQNSSKWFNKLIYGTFLIVITAYASSSFATNSTNKPGNINELNNSSHAPDSDVSINNSFAVELPEVIKKLQENGVEIVGKLDSPAEIEAYAAIAKQQPLAVYLTPDKKHVIIGTMIDEQGNDLTHNALEESTVNVWTEQTWQALTESAWIQDGNPEAERIVYMFTDPNCSFCHKFWLQSRPWIEAGHVQLRHILVGLLTETSKGKAAAILAAENSSEALRMHEDTVKEGGINVLETIPDNIAEQLQHNENLMAELLIDGTPGILYFDGDNKLQIQRGAPLEQNLPDILGQQP